MPKKANDQIIALLIRMWMAGMVCLFVAWTPLGGGNLEGDIFLIPLVFMLALFLFLTNQFIVNPIIRGMLRTKLDQKTYFEQPLWMRLGKNLFQFGKMVILTIAIWAIYILINEILVLAGLGTPSGRPALMLEPITFGFFYGLLFLLWDWVEQTLIKSRRKGVAR